MTRQLTQYSIDAAMSANSCQPNILRMQQIANETLYNRNVPSEILQAYIDVRPVPTKYSYFPVVDPHTPAMVPMRVQPTYSPHRVFNPGNTVSPWSGFATNVNTESELRNQIYALQKCNQSVYVPSSTSSLYTCRFETPHANAAANAERLQEKHPWLHTKPVAQAAPLCSGFVPNEESGSQLFFNNTRCQLRHGADTRR